MNLLKRLKAWATSWWYVPTIEARQAIMLRELRETARGIRAWHSVLAGTARFAKSVGVDFDVAWHRKFGFRKNYSSYGPEDFK